MQAPAKREIAWLTPYGKSRFPIDRHWHEIFQYKRSNPQDQIASLEQYLKIAPHLIPSEPRFLAPTLRHPDLNPNNIFINEDFKIVGLIDWQHSTVLPLFLQANIPQHFQNFGDEFSRTTKQPKLPDNFDQLNDQEKAAALEQYRRRQVHLFYMAGTSKHNGPHFEACNRPAGLFAPKIFQRASAPWEGDPVTLKSDLCNATLNWDRVTGGNSGPSPISLPEKEAVECLRQAALTEEADEYDRILREQMGISSDSWVPLSEYDRAVQEHSNIREKMLVEADDEEERRMMEAHWPWGDHDEDIWKASTATSLKTTG